MLIASLALAVSFGAMACVPPPPPPPHLTEEQRAAFDQRARELHKAQVQRYEQWALNATGIAHVVVEKTIGGYLTKRAPYKWRVGKVRILHAYRGPLKIGQKIGIDAVGIFQVGGCPTPPPIIDRGFSGVAAITYRTDRKSAIINFFLPPEMLKMFFDEGIIKSAQGPKGTSS